MFTYSYKLMNGTHATQNGVIFNNNMTRHLSIIAHHAIIANNAIVSEVAIGLNQAIAANRGFLPVFGSAVNGNKLPNSCVISDENIRIFTLKLQILGNRRDDGPRENSAVFSDTGPLHDGHIGPDPCTFTHLYILMDDRKRIYFNVRCDTCVWVNISMGMDHSFIG